MSLRRRFIVLAVMAVTGIVVGCSSNSTQSDPGLDSTSDGALVDTGTDTRVDLGFDDTDLNLLDGTDLNLPEIHDLLDFLDQTDLSDSPEIVPKDQVGDSDDLESSCPEDECLFEDECYEDNEIHPERHCLVCDAPEGVEAAWVVRDEGEVCRIASGVCDIAEVCDGQAENCPLDEFALNQNCDDQDPCTTDTQCNGSGGSLQACQGVTYTCDEPGPCESAEGATCNGDGTCTYPTIDPAGTFGPQCTPCPGGSNNVCYGHGSCDDGIDGTGQCTCGQGFALPDCSNCQEGYFGADCLQMCPGGAAEPCSGHGSCDFGLAGTGICDCDDGFTGAACETTEGITVPDVQGLPLSQGTQMLLNAGFTLGSTNAEANSEVPAGEIVSQDPQPGSIAVPGFAVSLVVSSGSSETLLPPNPSDVATPIDPTVTTDFADSVAFLWEGPVPIQTGVVEGALAYHRLVVLTGRVLDNAGAPLSGVAVTVPAQPDIGQTLTREDGRYDLAANGGGPLVLQFSKEGMFSIQRRVQTPWRDFQRVDDVLLMAPDSQVTTVDFSQPLQVAQGSVVEDVDGARQSTLLFPQGTSAQMILPGGSVQPLSEMNVRVTEYTEGELGMESMPAQLPSATAYTYCAEFSIDEAEAAGALSVQFEEPVIQYLDNFLDLSVGSDVPVGFYDKASSRWIAEPTGQVIGLVSEEGGLALIDLDGDGIAEDAIALESKGITQQEQVRLAELYDPGKSLWRVFLSHFSPHDLNLPWTLPDDARTPDNPVEEDDRARRRARKPCNDPGSVINVREQTLGESVPVRGTPWRLYFDSSRSSTERYRSLNIKLANPMVPMSNDLLAIVLLVEIAGQKVKEVFPAPISQYEYEFIWDGLDNYKRPVQGVRPIRVSVGYRYRVELVQNTRELTFGTAGGAAVFSVEGRWATPSSVTLWTRWTGKLGSFRASELGLGSWTLTPHHVFDLDVGTIYKGDGTTGGTALMGNRIHRIPVGDGGLFESTDIAAGPDGSVYIVDAGHFRVLRITPDGVVETFAGNGTEAYAGDGGPAVDASLAAPDQIAVAPDGSVYITDALEAGNYSGNGVIRRITPDGVITRVAGSTADCHYYTTWNSDCAEDVWPLETEVSLLIDAMAISEEGRLCWTERTWSRIRCIELDGKVRTIAGTGTDCEAWGTDPECGDGGPATEALIKNPNGLAFGRDGSLYVSSGTVSTIRRISPDGIITRVAGTREEGATVENGVLATEQRSTPRDIAMGPDGNLYFIELATQSETIRFLDAEGFVHLAAGRPTVCPTYGTCDDGSSARNATLSLARSLAVLPNLDLMFFEGTWGMSLRKVESPLPGRDYSDSLVVDLSGRELYLFDERGRHLETIDPHTGETLLHFDYDFAGRLISITDAFGNTTTIHRTATGAATAIESPDGLLTQLSISSANTLSHVSEPGGAQHSFDYRPDGLLVDYTDPTMGLHHYVFSSSGRLIRDEMPTGGSLQLDRSQFEQAFSVTTTSAEGLTAEYQVNNLSYGDILLTNIFGCCTAHQVRLGIDDSDTTDYADGTRVVTREQPDPRWGIAAPLPVESVVTLPSGLTRTTTLERSVLLFNESEPMSLEEQRDILDVGGRTVTSRWMAEQQRHTITTEKGRSVTADYNEQGLMSMLLVEGIEPMAFGYDSQGRLETKAWGTGAETRTWMRTWGDNGTVETATDPEEHVWSYDHDAAGRILSIQRPDSEVTSFGYNAAGRLTSVTPPGLPPHEFEFGDNRLVDSYNPPSIEGTPTPTLFAHDLDGRMTQVTRPDGRTIQFLYSGHDLAEIAIERGIFGFSYDEVSGVLSAITDPDGATLSFQKDGFLPTSVVWSGEVSGSVEWSWNDTTLDLHEETVNGLFPVLWSYDSDGTATGVGELQITRDSANGFPKETTLDQVESMYTMTGFGEMESMVVEFDSTPFYEATYTHDRLGRVVSSDVTIEGVTTQRVHTYDSVGRLVSTTQDGSLLLNCLLDANGNRVSCESPGGTSLGVTDVQDRLITFGESTFTYGATGEVTSRTDGTDVTTYSYDETGALLSVTLPDATLIEYIIDGFNRRVGRKVDGTITHGWLYRDDLNPLAELNADGSIRSRFVYGHRSNVPSHMVRDSVTYRFVCDPVGSPRLVVNAATGEVVQRMDYGPFGEVLLDTNPGFQPFGFAGGLYDSATGLVRFGARDYDASTGRFTAKDPMGFAGGSPNLYQYATGDPINRMDPTGMNPCHKRLRQPNHSRSLFPWSIPSWLDGVMGLGGAIWSGLSGVAATVGSGLLIPVTFLVAFEGALQTGETVAADWEQDRIGGLDSTIEALEENVPRGVQ